MEKTKEQIIWENMWCQYHETNWCGCSQEQKRSDIFISKDHHSTHNEVKEK